ncbi:peptidoglycan DD-metalloendopeptidase family protein [Vibrio tapetis subsp. quintayensis]|uniref:peptidoglycan DD-metalloendopeptidase family protein n=1 Tax=Vibrio tapetis TaxID=52443 RepID=UPI0025B48ACA|nr:peptidoglycan DD-metalloendopeptidase family protein [Vibrio tapetis]MDN3681672.1 peptidoglycan DD-metalloendopeptidase family protein [Vibrio tapetis subsp. quintayensis]
MSLKLKTVFIQCVAISVLSGCAAHTPAPVTSLNKKGYDTVDKGSYHGSFYEVEKGDTLYFIAYMTGKDVKKIIAYNRLKAPYTIHPGQKLRLWTPSYVAPSYGDSGSSPAPVSTIAATKAKPTAPAVTTAAAATTTASATSTKSLDSSKNSKPSSAQQTSGVANSTQKTAKKESTKAVDQSKSKEYVEVKGKQNVTKPVPKTITKNTKVSKWLWPTKGRIIKGFSAGDQGNKGIDIAGQRGQSIVSTANGTVVYSGNALRGYGNLVIVKHNDNYLSAYAHNERLLVKEGQSVKAGQKIATMGSSGANGVRLHFEIRYQGKSVNPNRYLP